MIDFLMTLIGFPRPLTRLRLAVKDPWILIERAAEGREDDFPKRGDVLKTNPDGSIGTLAGIPLVVDENLKDGEWEIRDKGGRVIGHGWGL